ncbi:toxin ParE1/3/4 [Cryobacterium mesophilum]|uniref:Toxin n=1 Tax=Terrimesophilobacter mesophilus TaxID=433647 RepID=A0A4R8VBW7_9MICO|nr:type II toxin-antitoxin system RelE/ParE family toxin [Terrimesophilobacter mesophilus]MBB5633801.1 toxin ParE1/3/4 [Terrimesophilobacter mesophilus]TFB80479.1 type II toxin-antitoxin system RelE/ParE family toxin [Terrimesophilobacter mesophilus]
MSEYRLTPAAQRDLASIWDFTVEQWGLRQAEKYIREIQAAIERVAADPERGHVRDDIREGYRSYSIGSHAVFYVSHTNRVDVIRVLHQRMDPPRHV